LGKLLLAFTSMAIHCSRPHGDPWPYFSVTQLLTASWDWQQSLSLWSSLCNFWVDCIENTSSNSSPFVVCVFIVTGTCILSYCLIVDVSAALLWLHCFSLQASCYSIVCFTPYRKRSVL
jgi:hypothetical protein